MNRRQKRSITLLIRLAASVLFIALLSRWLDWQELRQAATRIRMDLFLVSLVLVLLNEVIIAVRLRILMESMKLRLTTARVVKIGLMSRFYAVFLPSGIGLLLARWYKVTENRVERLDFAAVTFTEKILFLTTTLVSVAVPLVLFPDPQIQSIYRPLLFSLAVVFLIVFFVFSFCTGSLGTGRLFSNIEIIYQKVTGRKSTPVTLVQEALQKVFSSPKRMIKAGLLSVLIQAGIIMRIGLLILAVGALLPWSTVLWLGSFIFLVQVIPISFSGLGVRESAFAFAFSLYGLQAEEGTLVGLLFFLQALIAAGIGGFLEFSDRSHLERPGEKK
jgi:uncharacterized membrane protein YbhN (UPF0104 family)